MYANLLGFPCSSAGKESACNAGDPCLIPGSGNSSGEGIGYPFQCSWASLVAQMVKNPPVMAETWVQSLDLEDLQKEGMAVCTRVLAWRIPVEAEAGRLQSMEWERAVHDWATKHGTAHRNILFY